MTAKTYKAPKHLTIGGRRYFGVVTPGASLVPAVAVDQYGIGGRERATRVANPAVSALERPGDPPRCQKCGNATLVTRPVKPYGTELWCKLCGQVQK